MVEVLFLQRLGCLQDQVRQIHRLGVDIIVRVDDNALAVEYPEKKIWVLGV